MVPDVFFKVLGILHFAYLFLGMFIVGNVGSVISMILVRPLSPSLHERLCCLVCEVCFGAILNWSEAVGGLELIVTGDKIPGSAIVMSNHVSFTDSVVIHCVARR